MGQRKGSLLLVGFVGADRLVLKAADKGVI